MSSETYSCTARVPPPPEPTPTSGTSRQNWADDYRELMVLCQLSLRASDHITEELLIQIRMAALILALAGFVLGVFAAGIWLQASRVHVSPPLGRSRTAIPGDTAGRMDRQIIAGIDGTSTFEQVSSNVAPNRSAADHRLLRCRPTHIGKGVGNRPSNSRGSIQRPPTASLRRLSLVLISQHRTKKQPAQGGLSNRRGGGYCGTTSRPANPNPFFLSMEHHSSI